MLCWCVWLLRAVHQARGEMQLAVVIEGLRREGIELAVSPPQVVYK
jgi:GTP-binding protein